MAVSMKNVMIVDYKKNTMIKQEVPSLLINAWYLDDGVLVGKQAELQKVIDILLREGPARCF